ncbi:MAG: hypothetical protein R2861_15030 [Desulfobacterales bacterium]
MTLNLLLSHSPEQVRELLGKSFAAYQLTHGNRKKDPCPGRPPDMDILWRDFLHHLDFLTKRICYR